MISHEQNIEITKTNQPTKEAVVGFQDAYGTTKSDTIRFYQGTDVTFGSEGGEINLEEGSNTIQVDKNAKAMVKSNLINVSKVTAAAGSYVTLANVDFQDGRNATLKTDAATFQVGTIDGSNKNDTITVGNDSAFAATEVLFGEGTNAFTIGSRSAATIDGDVSGVNRLTLTNGTYDKKTDVTSWTALTAKEVTGTEKNDSFSFGNYSDVDLDSIDLGEGNDTLRIGSYAEVEIDSLDFGDGTRDALTIGSGSTLTVDDLDVDSLDSLSMGKGATLYLGAASYDAAMDTAWGKKYSAQIAIA